MWSFTALSGLDNFCRVSVLLRSLSLSLSLLHPLFVLLYTGVLKLVHSSRSVCTPEPTPQLLV